LTLTPFESVWLAFVVGFAIGVLSCMIVFVVATRRARVKGSAGQRGTGQRDLGEISQAHLADLHTRSGKAHTDG
jgi:hypothetical protein